MCTTQQCATHNNQHHKATLLPTWNTKYFAFTARYELTLCTPVDVRLCPVLQDIPMHVSTLSFLLIAVDRYRFMLDPMKPRMPSFVFALGSWLLAVCIVLPYPIYITYLDLGVSKNTLHCLNVTNC